MLRSKKYFLLFWGLLETWVFSGSILGWSALHYMLKRQGVYGHLCHQIEVPARNDSFLAVAEALVDPIDVVTETVVPALKVSFFFFNFAIKF